MSTYFASQVFSQFCQSLKKLLFPMRNFMPERTLLTPNPHGKYTLPRILT